MNSLSRMQGVEALSHDGINMLLVREFSDELKQRLADRFCALCYGAKNADDLPDYYSLARTAREFLVRYDPKSDETKLGMIGELLTHLLVDVAEPGLSSFGIFFNKEERSIKKGFDLTFISDDNDIWYAEVKSGRPAGVTAGTKAQALVTLAADDLKDKLTAKHRRSLWDAAMFDAHQLIDEASNISVRMLLAEDAIEVVEGDGKKLRGLIVAVVLHPLASGELSAGDAKAIADALSQRRKSFLKLSVVVIQKSTIERVVDYLRHELAAA